MKFDNIKTGLTFDDVLLIPQNQRFYRQTYV